MSLHNQLAGDKTTLITTVSGLAGGMYKTLLIEPVMLNVTLDGAITVVAYAVLSAAAGYITKFVFDAIKRRFF